MFKIFFQKQTTTDSGHDKTVSRLHSKLPLGQDLAMNNCHLQLSAAGEILHFFFWEKITGDGPGGKILPDGLFQKKVNTLLRPIESG